MKLLHENSTVDCCLIALTAMIFTLVADSFSTLMALIVSGAFVMAVSALIIYIDSFRSDWSEPLIGTFTFEDGELG